MHDVKRAALALAASLALTACGGDGAESSQAKAPANTPAAPSIVAPGEPAPAQPRVRAASVPATREPAPTAEDSAAAAKEDVSPEWKQRSRTMSSYDDCIRQARDVLGPARARIEAACERGRQGSR